MRIHAICGYPGNSAAWQKKWEPVHFQARNLVKGVKREAFGGYSEWVAQPSGRRLRQVANEAGNKLALSVASAKLAKMMDDAGIIDAYLVPVPSSQTIAPGGDFTGARLVAAIHARRPGLVPAPILHFDKVQPRAHDGNGERRWQMIMPHLRSGAFAPKSKVVLVDDVMTSGGHLRACARFLADQGVHVVDAFVIGRTVWERPIDMFKIPLENMSV